MNRLRRLLCVALAATAAAACGATDGDAPAVTGGTVGNVGRLPAPLPTAPPASGPTASTPNASRDPLGADAAGNRMLVVGDSITQAVGPDFGGQLCDLLERRGWYVGIDAEQNRDVAAGAEALADHLDDAEWDAFVVNLGSNYQNDQAAYADELETIVRRAAERPLALVTVTRFRDEIDDVNEVIEDLADEHDNVHLIDWAAATAADDALTVSDGLHLTEDGRGRLARLIASAVGRAPDEARAPGCADLQDGGDASRGDD